MLQRRCDFIAAVFTAVIRDLRVHLVGLLPKNFQRKPLAAFVAELEKAWL